MSVAVSPTISLAKISAATVLHVDPINGDDNSGARGRLDFPYATSIAAEVDAQSGDTIKGAPTDHPLGAFETLGKNGVTYDFTGARIVKSATLTDASPVLPWFTFTNKTCKVIGYPDLVNDLHDDDDSSGGQEIAPILISGTSNVTLRLGAMPSGSVGVSEISSISITGGTVDIESQGASIDISGGMLTAKNASITQSAGTLYLTGSAVFINVSGGTSNADMTDGGTIGITGGTVDLDVLVATSVGITGGTVTGSVQDTPQINIAGGSVNIGGKRCASMTRTGTSGTVTISFETYNTLDIDCASLSAVTHIPRGRIENSTAAFAHIHGGTVISAAEIIDSGTSGVLGQDAALLLGDVGGVKVFDVTLVSPRIRCTDPKHSCIRWLSEANVAGKFRIVGAAALFGGNTYVFGGGDGQRGCVFSFEGPRTATLNGSVNASLPTKNNFVSFDGAGTLFPDSTMSM